MRTTGIIFGILTVQLLFLVQGVLTIFGNGASRDLESEAIIGVGMLTVPLCVTGFIAFHTAKNFGELGFWIFCSIIAIGWGYVVYHQAFGEWVSTSAMEGVSLMGAFTIAVGVGLAKARYSEVPSQNSETMNSGSCKEEFIYRELRVFVKNDFYRYGARKFETVEAAKAYIDSFLHDPK